MSRIDKVSDAQAAEIRWLYENGKTVTEIAKMVGRCTRTVGIIAGTRKAPKRKRGCVATVPEPVKVKVSACYWPDGWTIKPIPQERLMAGR